MNREDIIRMAREAGFHPWYSQPEEHPDHVAIIERFAALVAADEREACAQLVEDFELVYPGLSRCGNAIRARRQA